MNLKIKSIMPFAAPFVLLLAGCASLSSSDSSERLRALGRTNDPAVLARVACNDTDSRVRLFAVNKLRDQKYLAKVACEAKDWEVRKAGFNKLEPPQLTELAQTAKDPAVVLAARVKLKQDDWSAAFKPASLDSKGLGNVLGAVALVDSPQPSSAAVVAACHTFIRKGDASRIPELKDLLMRFGDKPLAEDYLNCGQSQLRDAGEAWANANGFSVGSGNGSHRVQWGGGR
ncbi:MAG: hypothetical protein NTW21_44875 [Verrucomicrobia bacterium]|nr:hypothetical protein [Verrucomicrobiota bacterium]